MRRILEPLTVPAGKKWIAGRAVQLLTHYFIREAHAVALDGIARDWVRELSEYPQWAIEEACAWWIGRGNDYAHRSPMPGDISRRAEVEMGRIKAARTALALYEKYGDDPPAFAVLK